MIITELIKKEEMKVYRIYEDIESQKNIIYIKIELNKKDFLINYYEYYIFNILNENKYISLEKQEYILRNSKRQIDLNKEKYKIKRYLINDNVKHNFTKFDFKNINNNSKIHQYINKNENKVIDGVQVSYIGDNGELVTYIEKNENKKIEKNTHLKIEPIEFYCPF
jgi:hypothetical protein